LAVGSGAGLVHERFALLERPLYPAFLCIEQGISPAGTSTPFELLEPAGIFDLWLHKNSTTGQQVSRFCRDA